MERINDITMKQLLIIGIGGGIGSIFRFLVQIYIGRWTTLTFPLGTLLVNISGCLLIGLLYGWSGRYTSLTMEWRLFLITGLCGGYTTFSSFSYESMSLFRQGNYLYFIAYTSASFILGLLATIGGTAISE
jgi:CrcB protein